jgi:alanine dehydrogenase
MKIGCVKELKVHEYRVGLTPGNVHAYIKNGHQVYIETCAGEGSGFSDNEYEKEGAVIVKESGEIWDKSDMVIKVKAPHPQEYSLMRRGQIIYTYLHLAADYTLTKAMLNSGCIGVAYETITDKNGGLPLLKPMSEVAGRLSVQEGAKYLEKPFGGSGILLGGVPGVKKAKVVILGGGTVGTSACKIALGLGADVTVFDINIDRLSYLDDIFGGVAKTMYSSDRDIEREVCDADLVIGAVLIPGSRPPKLLKREYLKKMKKGSLIVDIAVDQGGCVETSRQTSHDDPIFEVDGINHYCVSNMPGAVPRTSTIALTNATLPYGLMIANYGLEKAASMDKGLKNGINIYKEKCTFKGVADCFEIEYSPISFKDSKIVV